MRQPIYEKQLTKSHQSLLLIDLCCSQLLFLELQLFLCLFCFLCTKWAIAWLFKADTARMGWNLAMPCSWSWFIKWKLANAQMDCRWFQPARTLQCHQKWFIHIRSDRYSMGLSSTKLPDHWVRIRGQMHSKDYLAEGQLPGALPGQGDDVNVALKCIASRVPSGFHTLVKAAGFMHSQIRNVSTDQRWKVSWAWKESCLVFYILSRSTMKSFDVIHQEAPSIYASRQYGGESAVARLTITYDYANTRAAHVFLGSVMFFENLEEGRKTLWTMDFL